MTLTTTSPLVEKTRINSIDLMRGIVMVIMALDHVRDFFHADANVFDPTDLTKTHPVLFFTRWITHYCAPTFVLLSGVAIRISEQRKSKKELSIFLLTRGLWLLVIEAVVMRFSFFFNFYYDFSFLQVIFVIGGSMIVLAALIHTSPRVIAAIAILLLLGHNAFDGNRLVPGDAGFVLWTILNQAGFLQIDPNHALIAAYPLIPWLSIALLGYTLGAWYQSTFDSEKRRRYLRITGLSFIAAFIILRGLNLYGDPGDWSTQKNFLFSVMSFINTTKYPVSLLYTLMTIGPVLIILSWMEKANLSLLKPLHVFGRVPLFYYILHFYIIHTVSLIAYMISHNKTFAEVDLHFNAGFGGIPFGVGYSLGIVFIVWICLVLFLYPLCKWYNNYKSTHTAWWLSYL